MAAIVDRQGQATAVQKVDELAVAQHGGIRLEVLAQRGYIVHDGLETRGDHRHRWGDQGVELREARFRAGNPVAAGGEQFDVVSRSLLGASKDARDDPGVDFCAPRVQQMLMPGETFSGRETAFGIDRGVIVEFAPVEFDQLRAGRRKPGKRALERQRDLGIHCVLQVVACQTQAQSTQGMRRHHCRTVATGHQPIEQQAVAHAVRQGSDRIELRERIGAR